MKSEAKENANTLSIDFITTVFKIISAVLFILVIVLFFKNIVLVVENGDIISEIGVKSFLYCNLNVITTYNPFVAGIKEGLKKMHKNRRCLLFAQDLLFFVMEILKSAM